MIVFLFTEVPLEETVEVKKGKDKSNRKKSSGKEKDESSTRRESKGEDSSERPTLRSSRSSNPSQASNSSDCSGEVQRRSRSRTKRTSSKFIHII